MIPKTIHYCWFSGELYPPMIKNCIESWKHILPDYTFKKWDASNTDFDTAYAQKAFNEKKWAFLTDYMRFKILYKEGGIFMDTDILMIKPFDDILVHDSFWNFADNGLVEPVVVGAHKGNTLVSQCKEIYDSLKPNDLEKYEYKAIPYLITPVFKANGLILYDRREQIMGNNLVLTHEAFCPLPFEKAHSINYSEFITNKTYCVHLWNAEWIEDEFHFFWNKRWKRAWKIVMKRIYRNPVQSGNYYKSLIYHLLRQLKIKK